MATRLAVSFLEETGVNYGAPKPGELSNDEFVAQVARLGSNPLSRFATLLEDVTFPDVALLHCEAAGVPVRSSSNGIL